MKKLWTAVIIGAAALAGLGYVATTVWAEPLFAPAAQEAAAAAAPSAAPLPPVQADQAVVVDAKIVPNREANLSSPASGIVAELLAAEGETVQAGAPLIRLEASRQQAAVAQAEANLRNAQLKLAELQAPARTEEVARFQAAVTAAQASLQRVLDGANDADVTAARAALATAEVALRKAQADYDKVAWSTEISMLPQAVALEQATNDYVAAEARLNDLLAGPKAADVTGAQAQVRSAQAELDNLLAGARTETIAAAEANVAAAEAALQDAQAALSQMTLTAPFAGVVAALDVELGEQVSPGTPVVRLADLSRWRLETDDLTELSVVDVQPGDRVAIALDALPGVELTGRVERIRSIGENRQGDIVFTVLVGLDEQDARLRWNMTAAATISADEAGRAEAAKALAITARAAGASDQAEQLDSQPAAFLQPVLPDAMAEPVQAAPAEEVTPGAAAPAVLATVQTDGANLNVRSGPGTAFPVVASAAPGDSLPVLGRDEAGGWLLVQLPGGAQGWISASFALLSGELPGIPVADTAPVVPEVQPVPQGPAAAVPAVGEPAASSGLAGTLVFQSGNGGAIYATRLDTGELWPVTTGMDPALSPDGRTVAFVRDGGEQGLYLIDLDGSNERRIFAGGQRLRAPAWSSDGAWIAFSRLAGEYECRAVGSGLCYKDSPFLEAFPLERRDQFTLSKVDANGQNFTDVPSLPTAVAPAWGDGGIVYQSNSGIQLTGPGPSSADRPVLANFRYQDPDWQPGGSRIVFHSVEGSHREIFSANVDGSDVRPLTRPADLLAKEYPQNVAPVWSPDGRQVAFLSNRTDRGDAGEWAIWVMDADGANQRKLPIDVAISYAFQGEQALSWR